MASDVFQATQDNDTELKARVSQARKRAAENPNDRDAQIELANVCEEGKKMWEVCERELSRLDQATTDGDEHATFVREINIARNHVKAYDSEAASASRVADNIKVPMLGGLFKTNGTAKAKQPKAQKTADGKDLPLWARIAIALVTLVSVFSIFGIIGGGGKSEKSEKSAETPAHTEQAEVAQESEPAPEVEPEPKPDQEPTEQVLFDGDTMRVTYQDWREEPYVSGCCYLYLAVENKTGSEVWFHSAYGTSSVNGYNGMFMQGLPTYVQAGNKAVMGIILTYKQFGVSSFDEVHTCDFDLVQEDKNNSGSEFARAHIHVER